MAQHAASHARAILRSAREGTPAKALVREALTVDDPHHRAITLARLRKMGAPCVADIITSAQAVERPGQKAETWATVLGDVTTDRLVEAAVQDIEAMPDGAWVRNAIEAVAPHAPQHLERLLRRALALPGHEVPAAKAVLRAAGHRTRQLRPILDEAPEQVRVTLLGRVAQRTGTEDVDAAAQAAWALTDPAARREALRVLAWRLEGNALARLRRSAEGRPPQERVHMLLLTAARADRVGMEEAPRWLAEATAAVSAMPDGPAKTSLERKLAQAHEHASQAPSPPEEKTPRPTPPAPDLPPAPAGRHTLALVDAYQGGLDRPHLQAVARAAPLCAAFGLDLLLIHFPTDDLETLVSLCEAETQIGEGAGHARALWEAGRLRLLGEGEEPAGTLVATGPAGDLHELGDAPGPICLLVGLGRKGLPRIWHNKAAHTYELTGHGISLETATAMGILADRLGRLPAHGVSPAGAMTQH